MSLIVGIICALFLSENLFKKNQALSIETTFKLPSVTPVWPQGGDFACGIIDLGGLQLSQVSTFTKVWATHEGGTDNQGATVFEPTGIPAGFNMLGSYSQPNNKPLFGYVLVAKDISLKALKQPVDYILLWSSASLKINQDSPAYVWIPKAPDGFKPVGLVVTITPDKPSLDKVRCVRADLTDQAETYSRIWGPGDVSDDNSFNFFDVRPSNRSTQARGVRVGTFGAQIPMTRSPVSMISCLKNTNVDFTTSMPNLKQIDAIVKEYSPFLCFHPDEEYFPSSVNWFFSNGALLYTKGKESTPVPIARNGTNLPRGGNDDGAYWLDLPVDDANKDRVKEGDLTSSKTYIHVKPMLGGTFTDIVMWVFYPFNGPARVKAKFFNIKLGRIGEHVGDWEHVTLRVSNFNGQLWGVYFSQHNKGGWVEASQLEFPSGNKPMVYSSLHGHASYPHADLYLLGKDGFGVRDDTAMSEIVFDMVTYELVSAEYLSPAFVEPSWLNYFREWGPKFNYDIEEELMKAENKLPGKLKELMKSIIMGLPSEFLGQEGPLGPKVKDNWSGDEI